ncbi:PRD domain-containing protein [Lactobacillus panisapium]|uniref:PRD domain-containing protein n=1 Tax=Lactobacillus panisapium TaxID=2012495 RepID=A0ABX8WF60_9LACO|nr:PRD domain-containing protein [Lactobacillus panisapium]QYN53731.1 PRD domain-containing protein [Lactobacillus panisapium]QYN59500.1 PRD domain-containing protein [Lactobacillus panisapium]
MKIIKVFNNNVVLVDDEKHEQAILFGNGIGFKKQPGDEVVKTKGVQTFIKNIKDPEWLNSLSSLLENVPLEYLAVSKNIVDHAEKKLNTTFNQFLIISLADHIYFAVKRNKRNDVSSLVSVKNVYPLEYSEALESVNWINSTFNVNLPSGEAGLIAIHFVENEITPINEKQQLSENATSLHLSKVLQIIIADLGYPEQPTTLERLTVHLRFLITQIQNNQDYLPVTSADNQTILAAFLKQFPELKGTLKKLQDYFYQEMKYQLNSSERLYLVIHLKQIENSSDDE